MDDQLQSHQPSAAAAMQMDDQQMTDVAAPAPAPAPAAAIASPRPPAPLPPPSASRPLAPAPRPQHSHRESHASLTDAMHGLTYAQLKDESRTNTPAPIAAAAAETIDLTADEPAEATATPAAAATAPPAAAVTPAAAAAAAPAAAPSAAPSAPAAAIPDAGLVQSVDSEGVTVVLTAEGDALYEVERILSKRRAAAESGSAASGGRAPSARLDPDAYVYKVKWKGFGDKDATWEPYANISSCTELFDAFLLEDEAAAEEKRAKRRAAKELAAATAAAYAAQPTHADGTTAAMVATPVRNGSASRLSLSATPISTFPVGHLQCGLCDQTAAPAAAAAASPSSAADFVFCQRCLQSAHHECAANSGVRDARTWTCNACAVTQSMDEESQPADASSATAAPADASVTAAPSTGPTSRSEQLRGLLLSVQQTVTRGEWQSVPLTSIPGSSSVAVDWQSLSTAFQACASGTQGGLKCDLAELVSVDVYEHLVSHLLVPCLQAGPSLRLVTGDGVQPSSSSRELMLKCMAACSLALQLLSMPNVPRRLIQEDCVRAVVEFILFTTRSVLLPLYDSSAREKLVAAHMHASPVKAAKKKAKGKVKNENETPVKTEEQSDDEMEEEAPAATVSAADTAYWSALQSQLRYAATKTATLLSLLTRFMAAEKFSEMLSSKVSGACYQLLSMTPPTAGAGGGDVSLVHNLQMSASHWLQKSFLRGDHATKQAILDSVALTYRNLNPMRKNLRTYIVHQGTHFRGVKKEGAAVTAAAAAAAATAGPAGSGGASAEELAAAIGSDVPVPTAHVKGQDHPQVSIQLLSALICQLLQSLATQPLITDTSNGGGSLLERIQQEVRQRELAEAAAAAADASAAAAPKKGSKKKKGRKGSSDASGDDEMKEAVEAAALSASFSATHSSLDTPQVRTEFISTITAPIQSTQEYSSFFLRKLFEYAAPPTKEAAVSSSVGKKVSKLLLRHFIEDLLQVLFAPEFPVAENLLMSSARMLITCIDGKDSKWSEGFRLVSISLLGLLTIHLKLHSSIVAEHPILFRPHKTLAEEQTTPTAASAMEDNAAETASAGEEVLDCICGVRRTGTDPQALEQQSDEAFLMDCDECHTWYHGECLGFRSDDFPANWHCQKCVIRMECERQTAELQKKRDKLLSLRQSLTPSGKGKGKRKSSIDHTAASSTSAALDDVSAQLDAAGAARVSSSVLRQLIINYLNVQLLKGEDESALSARQYDLCSWLNESKIHESAMKKAEAEQKGADASMVALADISPAFERELDACQLNWEPPTKSAAAGAASLAASSSAAAPAASMLVARDVAINMARQLALDRKTSVLHVHSRILDSLCARCNDAAPTCRATAVAALANMVRVDPLVLQDPRVKIALKRRVEDSSITTREAVVDLIGTHILQAQASSNQAAAAAGGSVTDHLDDDYFRFVLGRLNDAGISVRKKVVRILRDLCLQPNPHPRYSELAERLIMFDRNQSNVRDRVRGTKLEPQVKTEDEPMASAAAAAAPVSPFTAQFERQVQLIVQVISRLSAGPLGGPSDSAECLVDILLLLLEQDATLSKSGCSATGEMTSLTGLRMTLLKLKKSRGKQATASHTRRSSAASSLSAAFEKEGTATKGRGKKATAAAATDGNTDPNSIRRICEDMVTVIVGMLVSGRFDSHSGGAAAGTPAAAAQSLSMLHLVQALHVFGQVFPPFLIPHLQTLQPYLRITAPTSAPAKSLPPAEQALQKEAAHRDMLVVTMLLDTYSEVLPILATSRHGAGSAGGGPLLSKSLAGAVSSLSTNSDFFDRLREDLKQILTKSVHPSLIKGAAPTFVLVCEQLLGTPNAIIDMCRLYLSVLWSNQFSAALTPNVVRCIIAIPLFLKHFDIEGYIARSNEQLAKNSQPRLPFWSIIMQNCVKMGAWPRLQAKSQWMARADEAKTVNIVEPVFNLYTSYLNLMLPPTSAGGAAEASPAPASAAPPSNSKMTVRYSFFVLQGIIALFSRRPKLILKAQDAVERCLCSPHSSAELQRQTLKALREFLQSEDRRMQKSQLAERVRKDKKGGSSASTPSKRGGKGKKANDDEGDSEEDEEMDVSDGEVTLEDAATAAAAASSPASASATKASWVASNIDVGDFLPALVSACEQQVYALVLSPSALVRCEALQFMGVILHQAVTNPMDAMATLVAALTDRDPSPAREAAHIVADIVSRKKESIRFMEQRFIDGIRLSFHMQSTLFDAAFDPLHRRNLADAAASSGGGGPVFDRPPTEGLAHAYALIKKNAISRKNFCKQLVNNLLNVGQVGMFAKEAEIEMDNADAGAMLHSFASPIKALEPHASLNGRAVSTGSAGAAAAASPLSAHESPRGSQPEDESFPAFVPPAFERSWTEPSFAASPSSMFSGLSGAASDVPLLAPARPASPLAFIAYIAGLCTTFGFEDDEPMHLAFYLSKVINTRGAALQAQLLSTIVALKKLNAEPVDADEELVASQTTMQLAQPAEGSSQSLTQPIDTKESLLATLRLQCESAMAITILIRLRQWLQESYDLTGKYEEWNLSASGNPSSTSTGAHRGATKLRKVLDLPLHFHSLPMDEQLAEQQAIAMHHQAAGVLASPRKIAGRTQKAVHARSASTPVLPYTASIVPALCQAQFAMFNTAMERNAVFLATKSSKRGHKRAATMDHAGADDEGGAAAAAADAPPGKKSRAAASKSSSKAKAKKKRKRHDDDDDDDDDESEDDFIDDSPARGGRKATKNARAVRNKKKPKKFADISEEDEEEEEEEEQWNEEEEEEE